MKKRIMVLIMMVMILTVFYCVNATSMNSTPTLHYTPTTAGYDADGYYYFVQGNVTWNGYALNVWPDGHRIYYAPFLNDYTQAGNFTSLYYYNHSSGNKPYYSGYSHKAQYRVGSYTSADYVDTTFSFFV